MGNWHEIPFGVWLATSDDDALVAHWYVNQDPSRVDIHRNAAKSVLSSDTAQAIHEHIAGELCTKACKVLVPGLAPEDVEPEGEFLTPDEEDRSL